MCILLAAHDADRRNVRIPLPPEHWWPARARERTEALARARGVRLPGWRELQKEIAALGIEASEDAIRRCVLGQVVTWELADAVSRALGIHPPAVVSTSERHAEALANAETFDEIRPLLERLRHIEAQAHARDQMPGVKTGNGPGEGKRESGHVEKPRRG